MGCRVFSESKLDFEATLPCVEWHLRHRCQMLSDRFHQIGGYRRPVEPSEGVEQRHQFRWAKEGGVPSLVQGDDSYSAAQLDA